MFDVRFEYSDHGRENLGKWKLHRVPQIGESFAFDNYLEFPEGFPDFRKRVRMKVKSVHVDIVPYDKSRYARSDDGPNLKYKEPPYDEVYHVVLSPF